MTTRRGKRFVRHVSAMQTCIGLSSAESELYATTRGACSATGTQSNLAGWRFAGSDLSFKTIHLRHLWLQGHGAMGT